MKRHIFLLLIFIIVSMIAADHKREPKGNRTHSLFIPISIQKKYWEDIRSGLDKGSHPSIAIAPDSTPLLAWDGISSGNREIFVARWNGNSWEEVGPGSSSGGGISNNPGDSEYPALAIGPDGTPYVAWQDNTIGIGKIYVRRWNEEAWEEVGPGSASGGGIGNSPDWSWMPSLAISSDNTPCVAWEKDGIYANDIYFLCWNGSSWEEFGPGSASGGGISQTGMAYNPSAAFAPDNSPYIAWMNRNMITSFLDIYVRRWNGSSWEEIGSGSASGGGISNTNDFSRFPVLAISGDNIPYVVWEEDIYQPYNNEYRGEIYIRRWNGSSWEEIGVGSASGGGISDDYFDDSLHPAIAISQNNTPYVVWETYDYYFFSLYESYIYIRGWANNSWQNVGWEYRGIDGDCLECENPSLAISPAGHIYVAWEENGYLDVRKYPE